jgi:hypothetical protein
VAGGCNLQEFLYGTVMNSVTVVLRCTPLASALASSVHSGGRAPPVAGNPGARRYDCPRQAPRPPPQSSSSWSLAAMQTNWIHKKH